MSYDTKWIRKVNCLLRKRIAKSNQTLVIHKTWILILLLLVLVLNSPPAFAAQASEDTIAVFKAAIEAFKTVEHPFTGKGSALVETYVRNIPLKTGVKIFDFIFKGDLSRSTRFSMEEGKRDLREITWVVGEKCSITRNYRTNYASVQRNPPHQFYHQLGYDFNPSTFMQWYRKPLTVHTERLLDGPSTLSAKMDNDGILHLISYYKDQNVNQQLVVSVNPNMGYRLVGSLAIMERIDRPSRNHTDFLEVQWDKYESSWYVKSAKWASYAGIHSPEDRASLEPGNLRMSTTVTVTEFHPNVEISNSEFTLNGLGLPVGTLIIDKISGTNYKIGSGPESTDMPKEPLLEAEFPKSIKNQVNTKSIKQDTTDIDEQTEPEKETSISDEESTQESIADTLNHQHTQRNVLLIIALFVGIIAVLFIGKKLLLGLKVR